MIAALLLAATVAPATAHTLSDPADERRHIKRRALSQLGAPYSYGGTSPGGFDCSGFTRWVFKDHGADLPHSSIEQFRLGQRNAHKRIWKRKNLEVGDLVFFKTTSARVGHAGIYVGRKKFVSATSSGGVRRASVNDQYYWGSRWVGATRLGVTSE